MYGVPAREKTPLVIASAGGYPKDLNFYQTIKTLCNALVVAEDGGTIILVTRSDEGFGNEDTQRQIAGYATMLEREQALRADFSIGAFIGYLFAESAESHHMIAVTEIPQKAFGHREDPRGENAGRGSGAEPAAQRRPGSAGDPPAPRGQYPAQAAIRKKNSARESPPRRSPWPQRLAERPRSRFFGSLRANQLKSAFISSISRSCRAQLMP